MRKTILWLASYPKSGNTWMRLFLYNYLFNPDQAAPINQAHRIGPSDASAALYRKASKEIVDLHDQLATLRLRPKVLAMHSATGADVNFMKTHNVNGEAHGFALIPPNLTRAAIYILRNPLDVAVSYAHHYGCSQDRAVRSMGSDNTITMADSTVVHQYLGNWSEHVRSWTTSAEFKTHVVRFEDMKETPEETFGGVLDFIGAPTDPARLKKAIRFSSFREAKKQEDEHGFVERPKNSPKFFRSGKVGEGRQVLPQSAIDKIVADHGAVMREYGYLE